MSILKPGDRVRVTTLEPKAYGVIDAKQAGVYRVLLDDGGSILTQRSALAYQNSALTAKRGAA